MCFKIITCLLLGVIVSIAVSFSIMQKLMIIKHNVLKQTCKCACFGSITVEKYLAIVINHIGAIK